MSREHSQYHKILFTTHTVQHGGLLPLDIGAHACFYYARCAHQNLEAVHNGATYEGERDHQEMLNNIARSVAMVYGLDTPEEFLRYMGVVQLEAMRVGLTWKDEIMTPELKAYVRVSN